MTTQDDNSTETHQVSDRRRYAILAICCLSLFIISLDNTIVNVGLPSIQRSFHASISSLQWVVDSYILVIAGLLTLSGSAGDRLGHLRIFHIGLVIFTLASLACSLAPNVDLLVAFRVLQGIGGSMLNPNSLSLITSVFTDHKQRALAYGVWGGVFGVSAAAGPVLGGALTDSIGWRSIFWVNIPIGVAALVLSRWLVPESKADKPRSPDVPGQLSLAAAIAIATYAIIEGPRHGWSSLSTLGLFVVAVLLLAVFITVERRSSSPVVDLDFFRSVPFSGAIGIAVLAFAILSGFLFLNTLYLQQARHDSPLVAGLATLPATAIVAITAPLAGRLVARSGPRLPLTGSGLMLAGGGAVLIGIDAHTTYVVLAAGYALLGLGFGLVNPPITNTAISQMPPSQSGVAAAVASTARQVGSALGIAIVGSIASPFHTAPGWWLIVGCGVAVAVVGFISTAHVRVGD